MKCDDGSNWTKVCKAAMIRIKEKGDKMMVEIEQQKEPKTRHFEHVVPAKTTSHFGQDDNKLWCRWMIQKDAIQGDHPLFLMVYFENKSDFSSFESAFTRAMS